MDNQSIPLSLFEKILIFLSILIVVGVLFTIIGVWSNIPERIPIHYGFSGEADNYGNKSMLIILLVVITTVYASVLLSSKLQKSHFLSDNDEKGIKLYKNDRLMRIFIGLESVIIMAVIEIKTILISLGKAENLGNYTVPLIIALIFFTILFFYLRSRKIRNT
jgi:uncharacterized membrane protein